jgi:succinate dehydrogenase/fumarate reductase flavoprotein subunit
MSFMSRIHYLGRIVIASASLATLLLAGVIIGAPQAEQAQAQSFPQRHPRRAEVLRRDANLNNTINRDFGHLDGHFRQLKREDRGIFREQQRDARLNGGHITNSEYRRLNRQENSVRRQINSDLNR